ncbi:MAG: alpha/beta hydrolase, partial [Octadecabacter sp.]|nr:alpha/beta hydrolase [Octadecabacter sp.]
LKAYALEAAQMVAPTARLGNTARNGDISRRAVAAPFSDHVSILHSRTARADARAWLDRAYGRTSSGAILPTGWAILGLLFGLVLMFRRVAQILPQRALPQIRLERMQWALVLGAPVLVAPLVAVPLNPEFLPVLVADYLGLHLLVYGIVQLALLRWWRVPLGGLDCRGLALLLAWCALFGFALNRYAANFVPTPERLWIIAVTLAGTLPYMLADAALTAQSGWRIRLAVRTGLLASLALAVALNFEGLFFLLLIAPVLVLFYLVFGTMGRAAARRSGPLAAGLALVLAWALGVSFPLFQA